MGHSIGIELSELVTASKLETLDCSHLLNSEHRSKLSNAYSSSE